MRFLPLLSSLMSLASLDLGSAVSRQAKGLGYTLVAILFLLTAYVLGVCALAFCLSRQLGTWGALGAIALGFVGAAGLVFWFGARSASASSFFSAFLPREALISSISSRSASSRASSSWAGLSAAALARLEALEDESDIWVTCWFAMDTGERRRSITRLSCSLKGEH